MDAENAQAYPLHWPAAWPRVPESDRREARFSYGRGQQGWSRTRGASLFVAVNNLLEELDRLGAANVVISTNIPVRRDGLPYSNRREPDDSGVAVYFNLAQENKCFPCDRWDRVADNIHAIGLSVGALRGLDRWGASHMVDAAFKGFRALPAGPQWWETLGLSSDSAGAEEIKRAFRQKAKIVHPDQGGNSEEMIRLKEAYDTGLELRG